MMGTQRLRWAGLITLLLISGWLAIFGDKTPEGEVAQPLVPQPAGRVDATAPARSAAKAVTAVSAGASGAARTLGRLIPRDELLPARDGRASVDLFSAASWAPPEPKVVALPVVEPPPMAPPLPFTVLGKKLEAGRWEIYLSRAGQTLIAHEGDVLDGVYRVERIQPPQMVLEYTPLHQTQNLDIGDFE